MWGVEEAQEILPVNEFFQPKKKECHFPLQGIFLTQRSNPRLVHFPRLLHWQADPLPLAPPGKPSGLRAIDNTTMEIVTDYFLGFQNHCSHEIKTCLLLGRKAMTNLHSILKSRDVTKKGLSSQRYSFSSSHVLMWELDHKESWAPKNWCFWTVVLEKTLESPLDCKENNPVNPKVYQPRILIGRTDAEAEAEAPILWPPDKSWLIRKDPDSGKDWRWEEKGMTEDEMAGCITDSMDMSLSKLQEMVKDREAWPCCSP